MARTYRVVVPLAVLACVCLLLYLSPSAHGSNAPPAPEEIAKLPASDGVPPSAQAPEGADPADTGDETAGTSAQTGIRIAMLWDPIPRVGSAADLVEIAHEYGWNWDNASKAHYLEQAASVYAGTQDAGRALVILGRTHYEAGNRVQGDAILQQALSQYADAEVQAFGQLVQSYCLALSGRDFAGAQALLEQAADSWQRTELGAWAALQLGNLHRDHILDFDAAIPLYAAAMEAYPGTIVAEEAEVSIAECHSWSLVRPMEAVVLLRDALDRLQNPRMIARAAVGLGFALNQVGEYSDSLALLSDFIEGNPGHPGVPLAKAYRCYAAGKLGYWDLAVADAEAFIAAPIGKNGHPWLHNCENTLGQDAFRRGAFAEAQARFETAVAIAPDTEAKAMSRAGVAHCRGALGDGPGAIQGFLDAADLTAVSRSRCAYLHQAASVAREAGDTAAFNQILDQMISEFPGSHLTTRLVGHELLVPPEL